MITLPAPFTATKYPGYFWHTEDKKLFSIKISGELKELKLYQPSYFTQMTEPYYQVSVKGHRRVLDLPRLLELKIVDSKIPMAK